VTTITRGGESFPDAPPQRALKITAYDKASSFLISLLLMVGVAAVCLFIIWLSTVIVFVKISKPIRMIQYPGRGDHDAGFARDPEGPGVEELDAVMEDQPAVEAALEPVSNLASTVAANYDSFDTDALVSTKGRGGLGDSRPPGPLGEGENVVPPWQRWEIRYESNDENEYRRQLDYFGIEVGAAGGTKLVDYAFNVSASPISKRQGEGKKEERVYLTWKPGSTLRQFDENILRDAGIKSENRIVMQFLPRKVYEDLHRLEFENTDHDPLEWLKTFFKVRKSRDGYEFYIDEQLFRPRPVNARTG